MDIYLEVSIVNTALRDRYDSLETYCDDQNLNVDDLLEKISQNGFYYDQKINQIKEK